MNASRASPGFIMLAFLVLALAVPATVSSSGIERMYESRMSVPSIYYVDSTADIPGSFSILAIDVAADHPTDEVEVLDVGKVVNGAGTTVLALDGWASSSLAPSAISFATTSTGMTGTPVDPWEVSRGVGEMT